MTTQRRPRGEAGDGPRLKVSLSHASTHTHTESKVRDDAMGGEIDDDGEVVLDTRA